MDIITNSTIYLAKNLFGTAKTITCPDVEMATEEFKYGYGSYELPVGINAMKSTIVLTGFDRDVFDKISNPFAELNMTVYGLIDTYNNETLSNSTQAKLILRGASKKFPLLGELKQQENIEQELEFNISAAKLHINNVEKYAIDIPNLIWRKNDVDLLAHLRKNLAIN